MSARATTAVSGAAGRYVASVRYDEQNGNPGRTAIQDKQHGDPGRTTIPDEQHGKPGGVKEIVPVGGAEEFLAGPPDAVTRR
ncbi:hypothetical protein ACQP1V_22945 [Microtetraspora malaysiensis]|uniref:hypothetical protein n=1 Tax=Microtetraspora malaysiensis TaxID=161358 RepID=UPI003D8C1344